MTDMFADDTVNELDAVREKYKNDPEEAWKALAASQKHIQTLESERQTDREKLSKLPTVEDIVKALQGTNVAPPVPAPTSQTPASVLDEKTLETKVAELFDKTVREQAEKDYQNAVSNAMLNAYGSVDKSREVIKAKALELGMTVEALQGISKSSPKAFLQLFGLDSQRQQPVNTAPSRGTINMIAKQDLTPAGDAMEDFRKVLREDRAKAMSPEVQQAILAKAMKARGL